MYHSIGLCTTTHTGSGPKSFWEILLMSLQRSNKQHSFFNPHILWELFQALWHGSNLTWSTYKTPPNLARTLAKQPEVTYGPISSYPCVLKYLMRTQYSLHKKPFIRDLTHLLYLILFLLFNKPTIYMVEWVDTLIFSLNASTPPELVEVCTVTK